MELKVTRSQLQYYLSGLFIALILLNYFINNSVYSYILLAFAAFLTIYSEPIFLLIPFFLSTFIEGCFLITSSLTFNRCLCFMFIISFFIHNKKKISFDLYDIFLILCGAYFALSTLWSLVGTYNDGIAIILSFTVIWCMRRISNDRLDEFFNLFYFASCLFTIVLFILVFKESNNLTVSEVVVDEGINPNTVSCSAGLLGTIIYTYIRTNNSSLRFAGYVFVIMNIVTILFSGSRTSVIGLLIVIVFIPVISSIINKKPINFTLFIIYVLSILLIYLLVRFLFSANEEIFARFTFDSSSTVSVDRRFDVWKVLFTYIIPDNLFFGVGFGLKNIIYAVTPYLSYNKHAHNMIIAVLAETGLVGLIVFLTLIVLCVIKLVNDKAKHMDTVLGLLLFCFIVGMGEEIIVHRWFWMIIGMTFMIDESHSTFKPVKNKLKFSFN